METLPLSRFPIPASLRNYVHFYYVRIVTSIVLQRLGLNWQRPNAPGMFQLFQPAKLQLILQCNENDGPAYLGYRERFHVLHFGINIFLRQTSTTRISKYFFTTRIKCFIVHFYRLFWPLSMLGCKFCMSQPTTNYQIIRDVKR